MKTAIALIIALALLVIAIPLSRLINSSDQHTLTRTVDPIPTGTGTRNRADAMAARKSPAAAAPVADKPVHSPINASR